MTKILFPNGWSYLHIVKDWYSKEIVGWGFSMTSRTEDWLEALNHAINCRYPHGIRGNKAPCLITDNGCQPTSEQFMKACCALDIKTDFYKLE